MKKGFWFEFIISFAIPILIAVLIKYWHSTDIEKIISLIGVIVSALAILFIVRNTNRQIENQNKESHRPYITVLDADKIKDNFIGEPKAIEDRLDESDFHYGHIIATENSMQKKEEVGVAYLRKIVKFNLQIKNIGYGIACTIDFIPVKQTVLYYHSKNGQSEGDVFSTIDIQVDREKEFDFNIYIEFETDENGKVVAFATDAAHLLIFYTDLHGNIYSTMLIIVVNKEGILSYTCYPEGTQSFKSMMIKLKGNYENSIEKYINRRIDKKD